MPFDVFKKLFDTTVWSVISYGADTRMKHKNWCFHIDTILQSSDKNLSIDSVYYVTKKVNY